MTRRLRNEEQTLWAQVTASVTPLPDRQRPRAEAPQPAATPPRPAQPRPPATARATPATYGTPDMQNPHGETLDRGWDRRLASGRARPDLVVDLHGLTQDAARRLLQARVQQAQALGFRILLVITGKGLLPGPRAIDLMQEKPVRGAIRAALPRWVAESAISDCIAAVRQAHPRHGGQGAVYLILRRRR